MVLGGILDALLLMRKHSKMSLFHLLMLVETHIDANEDAASLLAKLARCHFLPWFPAAHTWWSSETVCPSPTLFAQVHVIKLPSSSLSPKTLLGEGLLEFFWLGFRLFSYFFSLKTQTVFVVMQAELTAFLRGWTSSFKEREVPFPWPVY